MVSPAVSSFSASALEVIFVLVRSRMIWVTITWVAVSAADTARIVIRNQSGRIPRRVAGTASAGGVSGASAVRIRSGAPTGRSDLPPVPVRAGVPRRLTLSFSLLAALPQLAELAACLLDVPLVVARRQR